MSSETETFDDTTGNGPSTAFAAPSDGAFPLDGDTGTVGIVGTNPGDIDSDEDGTDGTLPAELEEDNLDVDTISETAGTQDGPAVANGTTPVDPGGDVL
ncbi:MAG: hypothetical protein NVV72_10165 [Asticcacaulis sp.]|nr:hypothetical protein [Asticcacaulis sp.]